MPQAIVSDRGDDERGGACREVLFLDNDEVIAVYEIRDLRGSGAFAKELMRTVVRNALKEIGEWREALVLLAFAQERKLRSMIGEAVDLAVIEFRRTDCLSRRKSMPELPAQPAVGREFTMLGHPTRKGGWGDLVAVTGFQFGCGLRKGIAEVIERDAVENDAERIRFVAQFCRRGREHAPAQLALPQLHDLKLLAAGAFADEARAAAMRAARGRFDGVRNAMGVCK